DEGAAVADGGGVAGELERGRAHVALADAEVDGVAARPAHRVRLVHRGRVRDEAGALLGEVDGGEDAEAEPVRPVAPRRQVHPLPVDGVVHQAEEERVARDADGVLDGDGAVSAAVAAVEPAAPDVAAPAGEPRVLGDEPFLEADERHERLPRGAGRLVALRGADEQRLVLVAVEVVHVRLREAAEEHGRVVVRRGDHRDDAARVHVHHHGAAALVDEQTLGQRLRLGVDGEAEADAGLGLDVVGAALVGLHLHAVHVDEHVLPPDAPAQDGLVLLLDAGHADVVAEAVALLAHHGELAGGDLLDVAEDVGQARGAVVAALLVLAEGEPREPVLRLAEPPERLERDVLEEPVGLVGRAGAHLVPAAEHDGVRHAREAGHLGQVRGVEVARGDPDGGRRLVVHQECAVAVVDVAARRAHDVLLDRVALGLDGVALAVEQLHLRQPPAQEDEHEQHDDAEDAVPEAGFLFRGGRGVAHGAVGYRKPAAGRQKVNEAGRPRFGQRAPARTIRPPRHARRDARSDGRRARPMAPPFAAIRRPQTTVRARPGTVRRGGQNRANPGGLASGESEPIAAGAFRRAPRDLDARSPGVSRAASAAPPLAHPTLRPMAAPLRLLARTRLAVLLAALLAETAAAQYFGRNKVRYDDFDFQVLETEHFNVYYYPEEEQAARDVARMAERWYDRLSAVLDHEFEDRKTIVLYADDADFRQTNVVSGFIGQGTQGVTEGLKLRVVLPMASNYQETNHVLGHELVHQFQYDIARTGNTFQQFIRLPLWVIEGMAEYF